MQFAVLEFTDIAVIGLLVLVASGGAAASAYLRPADRDRLQRIEHKMDLILTQHGIDYVPSPKEAADAVWQKLADEPAQKITAIKAYREQHGVGLLEAKKAVEDYIEGRSK
jgi:ribosomal protein L7/L12